MDEDFSLVSSILRSHLYSIGLSLAAFFVAIPWTSTHAFVLLGFLPLLGSALMKALSYASLRIAI